MANVVAFGEKTVPGEPVAEIVETLEMLLAQAKAGDIRALAYAITRASSVSTGWDGDAGPKYELAAAIMALQHRYTASFMHD